MFKLTFLSFLFLTLSFGLTAKAFDVPALKGPVMDQAGILSESAQQQIEQYLFQLRQNSGPQVQVFITPSLQGEAIEQVTIQVFDKWKLGDAKKNNGLLFLIAPNERKMRIEVGRGLEGDIPDVYAKHIIMDVVSPLFKQKQYEAGVAAGVNAIGQYLGVSTNQSIAVSPSTDINQADAGDDRQGNGISAIWIFLIVIIVWIVLFIFNPTLAIYLLFSMFSGGGGSGGGRGGWSGGGGNSAGGGASGDW